MLLEDHIKTKNPSANEFQTERHIQNSNPDSPIELEPRFRESRGARAEPKPQTPRMPEGAYPLGMVLDACPDLADYAKTGISNWRDFLATVAVVRPMLGISPSAWEEAQAVMGEVQAAVVVAAILQRGAAISQRRRLYPRPDGKGEGRAVLARSDADGADRQTKARQEARMNRAAPVRICAAPARSITRPGARPCRGAGRRRCNSAPPAGRSGAATAASPPAARRRGAPPRSDSPSAGHGR